MGEEVKEYIKDQLAQGKTETFLRDALKKANIPEKYLDEILAEQKVATAQLKQTLMQDKAVSAPAPNVNKAPVAKPIATLNIPPKTNVTSSIGQKIIIDQDIPTKTVQTQNPAQKTVPQKEMPQVQKLVAKPVQIPLDKSQKKNIGSDLKRTKKIGYAIIGFFINLIVSAVILFIYGISSEIVFSTYLVLYGLSLVITILGIALFFILKRRSFLFYLSMGLLVYLICISLFLVAASELFNLI